MASMEDDITAHLHMCVALMSDPLTMRDRPGIVADHFMAAIGKIERLQILLTVPSDHCARDNWLGSSILNSGVRQMVGLVMMKHMEPLRWKHPKLALKTMSPEDNQRNAAPRIFAQEFASEGHRSCHETDIAREIKENNCMASLVLLYYYLHWHLLLILLNFRLHPCVDGREVESRLDVDRLLKGLPAFFDTFELRPLRSLLNRDYTNNNNEGDDLSDCGDDGDEEDREASQFDGIEPRGPEEVARRPGDGADGQESEQRGDADNQAAAQGQQQAAAVAAETDAQRKTLEMNNARERIRGIMRRAIPSGAMDGYMLSVVDGLIEVLPAVEPGADGGGGDGGALPRPEHRVNKRSSKLMNVYRMVLASASAVDKADCLVHVAHTIGYIGQETEVLPNFGRMTAAGHIKEAYAQHVERRIVQERERAILDGLDLCSHSLSVFELQDRVQRWFDMCRPFEVKSLSRLRDADDIDSTQKRYTCTLSEVLGHPPFDLLHTDQIKNRLKSACIHDFNSSALMMDVCGSFLKIHQVVSNLQKGLLEDSKIKEGLIVFIMQTYASDRTASKVVKESIRRTIQTPESFAMAHGLVSTPVGNFRKPARIGRSVDVARELHLFELYGHYWGSKPADFNTINHTYFAWPYVERGSYKNVLALINRGLAGNGGGLTHETVFSLVLSPGHRNSLYISSHAKSMLAMIDALHCTAVLDGAAISVKEVNTVHRTKRSLEEQIDPAQRAAFNEFAFSIYPSPVTFSVSKQTLIDDLRAELAALASRVERARRGEFKLYTGMSWPVVMTTDSSSNHPAFQLTGEMPAVPRTRIEISLAQIASAVSNRHAPLVPGS